MGSLNGKSQTRSKNGGGGSSASRGAQETTSERLPLIPLASSVLFPGNTLPLAGLDKLQSDELKKAHRGQLRVGVVTTFAEEGEDPSEHLAAYGTEAIVTNVLRLPTGESGALVKGMRRFRLYSSHQRAGRLSGSVGIFEDRSYRQTNRFMGTFRALRTGVARIANLNDSLADETVARLTHTDDPDELCNLILPHLSMSTEERLEMLALDSLPDRMRRVLSLVTREIDYLRLAEEIRDQVQGDLQESQRRNYLQEQIRAMKAELGELEGGEDELESLSRELEEQPLPQEARQSVDRELERMEMMSPGSPEYMVSHTYLHWIKDLPWAPPKATRPPNLDRVRRKLEKDHYGLGKIKERILEYVAVMRHKKASRGEILLLQGPPGVGKTSLARSIAASLGRPFERISLGGVRDEAEIRGHRRTYVGSMPGKLMQAIRKAGSRAPVLLLDELDKVGTDAPHRGDLSSALLEVLDYEQNKSFQDHYLGVPFDLSQVIFIATANTLDTIPAPLLDRMEVLELSSYTEPEKVAIAKKHLVPSVRKDLGLKAKEFRLGDRVLRQVIRNYTRESGVRQLRRELTALGRKTVKSLVAGRKAAPVKPQELSKYLGQPKYLEEPRDQTLAPGVAIGLAYTSVGGEILYVESNRRDAKDGQIHLTGRLGTVMQESAQAALSYLSALQARRPDIFPPAAPQFDQSRIHVHLPDGATPKDGPSAGVAIMTAIAGLFLGRNVPADLAMTGEITLRGQVLAVGGIREKILAAHRYGKRRVLIPEANRHDLEEIPSDVLEQLDVIPVSTMDEVLSQAGLWPEDGARSTLPIFGSHERGFEHGLR